MDARHSFTRVPDRHDASPEELVDRLVDELSAAWRDGSRPRAEDLLRRHPHLYDHPEAAVRLVYEEICLGDEHGEPVPTDDVLRRFPQWATELALMLDCQRLLDQKAPPPELPEVGETLDDFRILAELGRGALGRVFLASQPSLADRLLVLKATPRDGQEHLSLARLQHTHIVPLYWVEDLPERNLRILCMPFLGTVTLARVLEELAERPLAKRSGQDVLSVLDKARLNANANNAGRGLERERLQAYSYVQAVCWVGACLADALHYAHQRGIIHLDLKPSNVLLAADGQPMILDFHLARTPVEEGEESPDWLGGTREYMSPEQEAALDAVSHGRPVPHGVDGRSDVYSLGLTLYEALGGKRDDDGTPQPLHLPRANPGVSVGLADILATCLAANPADRYASVATLADDLRRHLEDRPLRGVRNRSPRELWRKWRRRRPNDLPLFAVALLCVGLIAGTTLAVTYRLGEQRQTAENSFFKGQEHLRNGRFGEAIKAFQHAQEQAAGPFGDADLAASLDRHLRIAKRSQKAQELRGFTTLVRFYAALEPLPPRARLFADGAKNLWDECRPFLAPGQPDLDPPLEQQLRADLLDLALHRADLLVRLAPPDRADQERRRALQVLAEAEELAGPSGVLALEKSALTRALGDAERAEELERQARANPARLPWEHSALGRYLLRAGDLEAAARELQIAVDHDPLGFAPHFYRGLCAHRRGRAAEAVREFSFCMGQMPNAELYLYRGLALAADRQPDDALKDFNVALLLDGKNGVVSLQRGLLHLQQNRPDHALADFHHALNNGGDRAEAHFRSAQAYLALNNPAAARDGVRQALRVDPQHAEALALRQQLDADQQN